jgi:large subunit ribosomal protein L21
MNDWVGLIIVIVVIFIVWWLLTRFARQAPEEFHLEHKQEAETHSPEVQTRAASLSPASISPTSSDLTEAPVKPDDLTILEGIGPKVNTILQAQGITTFAQLAETNTDQLKSILETHKLQFMDPGSWSEQAKLAAEGRMDDLHVLMGSLRGGKKV